LGGEAGSCWGVEVAEWKGWEEDSRERGAGIVGGGGGGCFMVVCGWWVGGGWGRVGERERDRVTFNFGVLVTTLDYDRVHVRA